MIHTNMNSSLLVTCGHLLLCVQDVHHFCFETSHNALYFRVENIFFNKYERLPWHDSSVCDEVYSNTRISFRFF